MVIITLKLNNIYNMDVREGLKLLDDESIDCVITSPPYWSLRDYGIPPSVWGGDPACEHDFSNKIISDSKGYNSTKRWQHGTKQKENPKLWQKIEQGSFCNKCGAWKGTLGLEPNFELFINNLCDIYDDVKRVLKKSGTCWVNLGDCYGSNASGNTGKNIVQRKRPAVKNFQKCLMLLPQRFAIEMVNRGWILRNVIIWHKPNAMPSSARDRFTVDFEYVYFFVKAKKYWFEQQREKLSNSKSNRERRKYNPGKSEAKITNTNDKNVKPNKPFQEYFPEDLPDEKDFPIMKYTEGDIENIKKDKKVHIMTWEEYEIERKKWGSPDTKNGVLENYAGQNKKSGHTTHPLGKNKRTVWTIPTKPNPEAHFATFPPKLVEPMIKSGCPEFICKVCGKPRENIYDMKKNYNFIRTDTRKPRKKKLINCNTKNDNLEDKSKGGFYFKEYYHNEKILKGYSDCGCGFKWQPGVVLDIFAGTGTTLKKAWELGRNYLGFEISSDYVSIANKILQSTKNSRLDNFF